MKLSPSLKPCFSPTLSRFLVPSSLRFFRCPRMGGEASLFHSIETRGIFLAGRRPLLSSMLIGKFVPPPQPPAQSFFRLPDSCPEDKAVGGTRKVFPSCGQQFFPGSRKFFLGSRYTYVREEGKVGRKVVVFEHVLPLKRDKKRHRSLALFFSWFFLRPWRSISGARRRFPDDFQFHKWAKWQSEAREGRGSRSQDSSFAPPLRPRECIAIKTREIGCWRGGGGGRHILLVAVNGASPSAFRPIRPTMERCMCNKSLLFPPPLPPFH